MQAFLTFTAETVAILGIFGIILHAFYTQNKTWKQTYCPPVKPYQLEQKIEKPKIEPKKEIIIPVNPPAKPLEDFSKMTVKQLTEICKLDKEKYKGYTTQQKKGKQALIDWMQTR